VTNADADDLSTLPDSTLAHLVRNLECVVAALECSSTTIGVKLLQQYQEALAQARLEQERRKA
jgi:hypothetical protein